MSWTTAELAGFCAGRLSGAADARIETVSTDTRTLSAGSLFVALVGERFDGHDYLDEAIARGACAVLVSRDVEGLSVPAIRVDDTVTGLGALARAHRERFELPVVAITGSNGKTTTREICALILASAGVRVRRTQGNLNNHIGLPLSVLQLSEHDDVLVVEMGMNHEGEIERLARIASPTVGAITNVAPAHLGPLGSIEAIARAKGELFEGIRSGGTAIVNVDNSWCVEQSRRFEGARLSFGTRSEADFRGVSEPSHDGRARFTIETRHGRCRVGLTAPGLHLMEDALCAAAAAFATGRLGPDPLAPIRAGLESFTGVPGRLAVKPAAGDLTLIDDSYNSNPDSVRAALATLVQMRGAGRGIAVLGDMLELGDDETELHADIGRTAAAAGVDALIALGPLSRHTVVAARGQGLAQARHAADTADAAAQIRSLAKPGDTVLIKGSRGMAMERVVAALVEAA